MAGEVRSLAQRSAAAAREIKGLIDDSVAKVSTGSQQVEQAGTTIREVVGSVQRVSTMIGEISTASSEQGAGIAQVNLTVAEMDRSTQQNSALVEEALAAAESLRQQAANLSETVSRFRL